MILPYLKRLIHELQPDYIVHTGDLIDNVKLQLHPSKWNEYKRHLKKLKVVLQETSNAEVHVAAGNHDDLKLMISELDRSHIYEHAAFVSIEGFKFYFNHYCQVSLPANQVDFALYGHDLSVMSHQSGKTTYLNGIEHIHLIDLETGQVHRIDYPSGTDEHRLNKHRIGI